MSHKAPEPCLSLETQHVLREVQRGAARAQSVALNRKAALAGLGKSAAGVAHEEHHAQHRFASTALRAMRKVVGNVESRPGVMDC